MIEGARLRWDEGDVLHWQTCLVFPSSSVLSLNQMSDNEIDFSASTKALTRYFSDQHQQPPSSEDPYHPDTTVGYLLVLSTGWEETATHLNYEPV